MTRRRKRRFDLKYIIALIVIIIVVIIAILSHVLKQDKKLNFVEVIIKDTVVGIQRVVYFPFKWIGGVINDYNDLKNVLEENKILKNNIDEVESVKAENIELKRELETLKEELEIDYVLTDYSYLNATVVSRNTGYWYNTITINKGSHNGIEEGMVVINKQGLIGKVAAISNFTSEVKLITTPDTNNKISVSISNGDNKITGLLNSYDYESNLLQVEGISNTENVNVGDYVYTSGLGGVFPSGILIGKVENISTDVYDLSKIINVLPSVLFDDINYVSVLKREDSSNDS